MSRRAFLKSMTALIGGLALPAVARAATSQTNAKTLQHSPLAGFQYHHGRMLYSLLAIRPEPSKPRIREAICGNESRWK